MTIDQLWVLLCTGLVFLMQAGFMCLESGLTRAKNSINVAVKNIADFGISVALFWVFGYGIMFGISRAGWIGTNDFFPSAEVDEFFRNGLFSLPSNVLWYGYDDYFWCCGRTSQI